MTSDPLEFDRLARRHRDAVLRQMLRACGNPDDAEDVLVEALLSAFRARKSVRDPEAFGVWLARIAHRACARVRRKEALEPILLTEGLDPASPPPETETKQCLMQALESLPEPLRGAVELRDMEGLSAAEAAARLGIGEGALKSRLHRARMRLRTTLDESLGERR